MKFGNDDKIRTFAGPYRFLSNFYVCSVRYRELGYYSAESAYQASKTHDIEIRQQFVHLTPAEAKKRGRTLVMREDWDDVKLFVMYEILCAKFEDTVLREKLAATGKLIIEEGNWWHDRYWGVCPPGSGNGENHLGKLLMRLRSAL